MGKYQNVGTPKFYIDYFQYALTTGLITVDDISNDSGQDNNELKKLFYLNPSSTKTLIDDAHNFEINTKFQSADVFNLNYCAFLGHNNLNFEKIDDAALT
jgi:hypothetical protein